MVRPGHTRGGGVQGRSRGRGRGRGRCRGRGRSSGRGRGHGRGRGRDPFAGLLDREKEVLCGVRRHQESNAYVCPFSDPTPGPAILVDGDSARELFESFYTNEVWDLIVAETNRYAAQQWQQAGTPGRPWHDVTVEWVGRF